MAPPVTAPSSGAGAGGSGEDAGSTAVRLFVYGCTAAYHVTLRLANVVYKLAIYFWPLTVWMLRKYIWWCVPAMRGRGVVLAERVRRGLAPPGHPRAFSLFDVLIALLFPPPQVLWSLHQQDLYSARMDLVGYAKRLPLRFLSGPRPPSPKADDCPRDASPSPARDAQARLSAKVETPSIEASRGSCGATRANDAHCVGGSSRATS